MVLKPSNPAVAIALIGKSDDKEWLLRFRSNMVAAEAEDMIEAIDKRMTELGEQSLRTAIGKPLSDLTLVERVDEAVRVYETFLAHKHEGKRIRASRTNAMIKKHGHKYALIRTVKNLNRSSGLDLLAKHGRLDCAYERIILDFPNEFEDEIITKALRNLSLLSESAQCVGQDDATRSSKAEPTR